MEHGATLEMLYLALVVLLPLIPAYILFKALPTKGEVKGPFQGLNIKFSGAFAGYLVVFAAVMYTRPTDFNHYHTWTVRGHVDLRTAPNEEAPNLHDVIVRVVPPHLELLNGGYFAFQIPVVEDGKGRSVFPDLQLDLKSFQGATIGLNDGGAYGTPDVKKKYNEKEREIVVETPIVLQSLTLAPRYDARTSTVVVPIP